MHHLTRARALAHLSGWSTFGPGRGAWRRDDPETGTAHPQGGGTTPADGGKPADPAADPAKKPKLDGDFDPDRALNDLGKAREDAKREKELRVKAEQDQQAKLDAVLIALGLKPDPNTDPAATAAKVAKELTDAQAELRELRAENAVLKQAGKLGADATALQDSRQFVKQLGELDPAAADYDKAVAALIKQAVKDSPRYAANGGAPGGQGPARQGADTNGGSTRQRPTSLGAAIAASLGGGQ